jgi:hypothetical protein
MKSLAVLTLAIVANLSGSDQLVAESENGAEFTCVACFTAPNWCEGNEDAACDAACDSSAAGECNDYDPGEVYCETTFQVYDWVACY